MPRAALGCWVSVVVIVYYSPFVPARFVVTGPLCSRFGQVVVLLDGLTAELRPVARQPLLESRTG